MSEQESETTCVLNIIFFFVYLVVESAEREREKERERERDARCLPKSSVTLRPSDWPPVVH